VLVSSDVVLFAWANAGDMALPVTKDVAATTIAINILFLCWIFMDMF
jgi:hypothetical protein